MVNCAGNKAKVGRLEQMRGLGRLAIFQADLEEESSFDEAISGCDYVFLVAAPVNLTSDHPEVNNNRAFGCLTD